MFLHGGGGDYTQLVKHAFGRAAMGQVLAAGFGIISPSSAVHGSWHGQACSAPGQVKPEDPDMKPVLYTLLGELTSQGLIDSTTPIVPWGFSNGCNPSLDLRTCGPSQIAASVCGGTKSKSWYLSGTDVTTSKPVNLHIGVHDTDKTLPNGTQINKVEQQAWSFNDLTAAGIPAERCMNEVFALSLAAFQGGPITDDDASKLWTWLTGAGAWVDSEGFVVKNTEAFKKTDIMQMFTSAGVHGASVDMALFLQDVLRESYAGHALALGCIPSQVQWIKKQLGQSSPGTLVV